MIPSLAHLPSRPTAFRGPAASHRHSRRHTPLVAAARVGDVAAVSALLTAGTDPSEIYEFSDSELPGGAGIRGRSALMVAVQMGRSGLGIHADDASAGEMAEFGIRILTAHATYTRPEEVPMPIARAALLLWCNQAAAAVGGLPGVSAELVDAILRWVHDGAATPPRLDPLETRPVPASAPSSSARSSPSTSSASLAIFRCARPRLCRSCRTTSSSSATWRGSAPRWKSVNGAGCGCHRSGTQYSCRASYEPRPSF